MSFATRQRFTLFVGIPLIAILLLYRFLFGPYLEELSSLKRKLPDKKAQLAEVEMMATQQKRIESSIADLEKEIRRRGRENFDFYVFVRSSASAVNIKDDRCKTSRVPTRKSKLKELSYVPSQVNVTLEGVTFKELTDFLHHILSAEKLIVIDNMELTAPGTGKTGLAVEMTVSTLVPA